MFKKFSAKQKVFITMAFAIGTASLLLGGSLLNWAHNKLEMHRLLKKRTELDQQYEQLVAQKKLLLDQDPAYMELLARTRYNMVKPGEIEFRFKKND